MSDQKYSKGPTLIFADEARTYVQFPSDHAFATFRDEVHGRYVREMVRVERNKVYSNGAVVAIVNHASNLGAELRGIAHGYGGQSEHTYYKKG